MNEYYVYGIGQSVWIVSEELSTVLECSVLQVRITTLELTRDVVYNLLSGHNTIQAHEADIYSTLDAALNALALTLG